MESEPIKELLTKSFMEILQQKPYARQPEVVHEFIKALTNVGVVSKDTDDLASLADSCYYWIDSSKEQQYSWDDYYTEEKEEKEEIEDKDLGLVRKINLK